MMTNADAHARSVEADALFEESVRMFKTGGVAEAARDKLFEVIEKDPEHVAANSILACTIYTENPTEGPKYATAWTKAALSGIRRNKASHAKFACDQFLLLGEEATKRQDWAQATLALTACFELSPNTKTAEMMLQCAELAGLEPGLLPVFETYLEANPSDLAIRLLFGKLFVILARDNKSGLGEMPHGTLLRRGEDQLKMVLENDPHDPNANFQLFFINLMKGDQQAGQQIIDLLNVVAPEKVAEIASMLGH